MCQMNKLFSSFGMERFLSGHVFMEVNSFSSVWV